MNIYDIALDFILLDAFEDLDNPPAAVVAVLQNRWITAGMKTSVRHRVLQHYSTHHTIIIYCPHISAGSVSCDLVHFQSKEEHAQSKGRLGCVACSIDTPCCCCSIRMASWLSSTH